ncbi:hypothetical protein OWV82_007368 [Melia azedarach]|uniref:Uncharacterized protein n=1 Tax=Melia azedarach TaxID=155640 RepID=A0ACC1Y6T2_MELAZ|nr:hypothetical protein OWV82_007368 [Melia azedarach]
MAADSAKNNTCRCRILSSDSSTSSKFQQPNSPLSYFFSISIAQAHPKIRIKIPKMLGKSMQRRSCDFPGSDGQENHKRDMKKRVMSRRIFTEKVGLMFCKVFGQKKISGTRPNDENGDICSNGDCTSGFLEEGKEPEMSWENVEVDDIQSSRNYVHGEEKQSGNAGAVDEGRKQRRQQQASIVYNKKPNFFNKKKNGFSFFRSNCRSSNCSANVVVGTTDFLIGKLERSPPESPRLQSRIMTTSQKLKIAEGEELCKKRILMGGKCRPLNTSGILQYDKDGILLPDNLP